MRGDLLVHHRDHGVEEPACRSRPAPARAPTSPSSADRPATTRPRPGRTGRGRVEAGSGGSTLPVAPGAAPHGGEQAESGRGAGRRGRAGLRQDAGCGAPTVVAAVVQRSCRHSRGDRSGRVPPRWRWSPAPRGALAGVRDSLRTRVGLVAQDGRAGVVRVVVAAREPVVAVRARVRCRVRVRRVRVRAAGPSRALVGGPEAGCVAGTVGRRRRAPGRGPRGPGPPSGRYSSMISTS